MKISEEIMKNIKIKSFDKDLHVFTVMILSEIINQLDKIDDRIATIEELKVKTNDMILHPPMRETSVNFENSMDNFSRALLRSLPLVICGKIYIPLGKAPECCEAVEGPVYKEPISGRLTCDLIVRLKDVPLSKIFPES